MSEDRQRSSTGPSSSSAVAVSRGATLVITNATKLAGVVVGVHEAFTTKDALTLGLAGFMMTGAQVSERIFLAFLDRFFGRP
jgi:hypothetical protein